MPSRSTEIRISRASHGQTLHRPRSNILRAVYYSNPIWPGSDGRPRRVQVSERSQFPYSFILRPRWQGLRCSRVATHSGRRRSTQHDYRLTVGVATDSINIGVFDVLRITQLAGPVTVLKPPRGMRRCSRLIEVDGDLVSVAFMIHMYASGISEVGVHLLKVTECRLNGIGRPEISSNIYRPPELSCLPDTPGYAVIVVRRLARDLETSIG